MRRRGGAKRRDGAKAPFPVVLRLIDALCEAGAVRIRRPACPRCRRVVALSKQRDGLRICRNCCARARAGDQGTSPWLLPGGRPGQPISPDRLNERLRQIGIRSGPARSTALFQLATELPAAILARMLGIHIDVAVAWQRASAGDWMTYAAAISRRQED